MDSVIAVAWDNDKAGEEATNKLVAQVLADWNPTLTTYYLSILRGDTYESQIRHLNNFELADQYQYMQYLIEHPLVPSAEWQQLDKEDLQTVLNEISRRSFIGVDREFEYISEFNLFTFCTEVLAKYGISAMPGQMIRCPAHDDVSPSLRVMDHDKRVYCHAPYCLLNGDGHGQDAWGLDRILRDIAKSAPAT